MKEKILSYVTGIFIFLLVPYFLTILINGLDTALMNRTPDVEMCLPAVVSQQIQEDYDLETIKSQAVIARTNLYRKLREKESLWSIFGEMKEGMNTAYGYWKIPDSIYEKAVEQTEGQILLADGALKLVPYHEISGGTTRDGTEVFHDSEYSYLKSVDSSADKESPDYLNSTYISQQQMPKELDIEDRDQAGYVMSLSADGNQLEGEAFGQGIGLSSANFTIQKIGDEIRFLCKGKGHGVGFSQYGGNVLAESGSTYEEILEVYFPAMEMENIHNTFVAAK